MVPLPFDPFSVKMISHWFNNDEVQALLFSIQICCYCIGGAFGITFMLKNEVSANQTLSRWCYMVDQNLTVLFTVKSPTPVTETQP